MFFKNPYIISAEIIEIIELTKKELVKAFLISFLYCVDFFNFAFLKVLSMTIIHIKFIIKYKIKFIFIPIM